MNMDFGEHCKVHELKEKQ